ncbi:MAG: fumarate hydratase C-terminal domain-containing protein, partial [Pseudobutyrivibrio sp.]|nr:fumarate hydratase C-terminal domain-containing protein [Pseudobutyrivibrio sp.]
MEQKITTPIAEEVSTKLHAGDYCYISGEIYVARDAAHLRMNQALDAGEELPIPIENQAIY